MKVSASDMDHHWVFCCLLVMVVKAVAKAEIFAVVMFSWLFVFCIFLLFGDLVTNTKLRYRHNLILRTKSSTCWNKFHPLTSIVLQTIFSPEQNQWALTYYMWNRLFRGLHLILHRQKRTYINTSISSRLKPSIEGQFRSPKKHEVETIGISPTLATRLACFLFQDKFPPNTNQNLCWLTQLNC